MEKIHKMQGTCTVMRKTRNDTRNDSKCLWRLLVNVWKAHRHALLLWNHLVESWKNITCTVMRKTCTNRHQKWQPTWHLADLMCHRVETELFQVLQSTMFQSFTGWTTDDSCRILPQRWNCRSYRIVNRDKTAVAAAAHLGSIMKDTETGSANSSVDAVSSTRSL